MYIQVSVFIYVSISLGGCLQRCQTRAERRFLYIYECIYLYVNECIYVCKYVSRVVFSAVPKESKKAILVYV